MGAKERYAAFMKSKAWKRSRAKALQRAGHKCERCQSRKRLQVHHKHYNCEWGKETPDALEVLCIPCHRNEHGLSPETASRPRTRKPVKQARDPKPSEALTRLDREFDAIITGWPHFGSTSLLNAIETLPPSNAKEARKRRREAALRQQRVEARRLG